MSPRLRKVTTASGATAVQIVCKHRGKVTVLEHLGSAHTEAELKALLVAGDQKLADYGAAEQLELELGLPADTAAPPRARTVVGTRPSVLIDAITASWKRLGFAEVIDDNAFFQLALARLVEPTSKADSVRLRRRLYQTGSDELEECYNIDDVKPESFVHGADRVDVEAGSAGLHDCGCHSRFVGGVEVECGLSGITQLGFAGLDESGEVFRCVG